MNADHKLASLLKDTSFIRWVKGQAEPEEKIQWESWEKESILNTELKKRAQMLYQLPFDAAEGNDLEEQLTRLEARIDKQEKVFQPVSKGRSKSKGYWPAVAAITILLISLVGVLTVYYQGAHQPQTHNPLFSTIEVGYGEEGILKISDGSHIKLNANTTLRYSAEQFNSSRIEVWLKGEAFFSIVRKPDDKKRTFIVHTPDGDIRVLGTRFNVNTRFKSTGVVLEEGSIEVMLEDSVKGVHGQFIIEPGQRAEFSSSNTNVQIQQVDTRLYTAWLNEKLIFDEVPLKEIVKMIKQTYGVSLKVENPAMLDTRISGTLYNPDLKTLFEGMEKVFDLDIQQKAENSFLITNRKHLK